jgi:hypothetical protein
MPTIVRNIDNTSNILFSDNFNRANGSIGSNYQAVSGSTIFEVDSNATRIGSTAPSSRAHLTCVSTASLLFPPNQEAEVTFTTITSTNFDFAGPAVRVNPTNATGYVLRMDGNDANGRRLSRVSGPTATQIGNINLKNEIGDKWSIRAVGNVISAYRNGVLVESVIDNTYTSGQPGLFYDFQNNRGARMDDFKVRSLQNSMTISSTDTRGRIIGRST